MARPCAVVAHVCSRLGQPVSQNARGCHGLGPWSLTFAARLGQPVSQNARGCHGLGPWSLTFAARLGQPVSHARGMRGAELLAANERETPRGKPVASGEMLGL